MPRMPNECEAEHKTRIEGGRAAARPLSPPVTHAAALPRPSPAAGRRATESAGEHLARLHADAEEAARAAEAVPLAPITRSGRRPHESQGEYLERLRLEAPPEPPGHGPANVSAAPDEPPTPPAVPRSASRSPARPAALRKKWHKLRKKAISARVARGDAVEVAQAWLSSRLAPFEQQATMRQAEPDFNAWWTDVLQRLVAEAAMVSSAAEGAPT